MQNPRCGGLVRLGACSRMRYASSIPRQSRGLPARGEREGHAHPTPPRRRGLVARGEREGHADYWTPDRADWEIVSHCPLIVTVGWRA